MDTTPKQQKLSHRAINTILKLSKFIVSRALYFIAGILIAIVISAVYAAVATWPAPQVSSGNPLTAELWNTFAENLDDLNNRVNIIEPDLVYGIHSSIQCTNLGGVVKFAGSVNVCSFAGGSCPVGWANYNYWSVSSSVYERCDTSCYFNPSGSTIYEPWTGPQSCSTGGHAWSNIQVESCVFCKTCSDLWTCSQHKTIYANYVEIGCY